MWKLYISTLAMNFPLARYCNMNGLQSSTSTSQIKCIVLSVRRQEHKTTDRPNTYIIKHKY